MTKPTVAFCIPNMVIGGVESVFIQTLDELRQRQDINIIVYMLHRMREPFYREWFARHNVPLRILYPCGHLFDYAEKFMSVFPLTNIRKIMYSLYKKYRNFINLRRGAFDDCDIIIDYKNCSFDKIVRTLPQPKITWIHGSVNYFNENHFARLVPHYAKIVCLTDNFMNEFKSIYPALGDKIVRIYNPVEPARIKFIADQMPTYPGQYFLAVSRLDADKDNETIIRAFDEFWTSQNGPDVKLVIVGDGNQMRNLRELVKKLPSGGYIAFVGANPVPFGYMRGAIAHILSSYNEGLGMVLLENASVGTLNISSDCPNGPREILMDGRAGILFTPGDTAALAQAMRDVYTNQVNIAEIKRNATNGLERFCPEKITQDIVDLINQTIAENR